MRPPAHLQTQSWFHQQVGSCAWGCGGCSGRAAGPRRRRQGPCACHLGRSGHGQRTEGGLEQAGQVSRCCLLGLSGSPAPAGQLCAGDPGGIPGAPSAPCGGQGAPGLSAPPPAQSLCGLLGEGPAPARSVTAAGHPQAWQNLRVTEQHLTLLNEIPPSFRVLTLQHSPDRCAFPPRSGAAPHPASTSGSGCEPGTGAARREGMLGWTEGPPQAGRGAQPRWVGQHGPGGGQAGTCGPQHGACAATEGHSHRGAEGLPGTVRMGLCPFWLPTWPRRSWGGAPAGMEVGGSLSLHLWGSSGTPRSGDPALRPAHRTHLYCAAYERPRPVPAAKGKLLQVGGEFCRLCRPGARGPGTRAAGGSTTHTWGPALPMLAWGC